jgi:hypothetical protein
MKLPPELICMVKSSLTNRDLYFVDLTCRYLFWCSVSNKEWRLRKCQLWNKSPPNIISEFKSSDDYCSHVICWKYRCQYLSFEDIRSCDNHAFRWAAHFGHLPLVQYICEKFQFTIEYVRTRNNFLLRVAVYRGHLAVVQYLCEMYQLTIQDVRSYNNEALRCAAYYGHLQVVQYLCEKFQLTIQDVRSCDNYALRLAARYGHLPVVQYLCEYRDRENRQLTVQDVRSNHNEALRLAATKGHLPVVKYLCEKFQLTMHFPYEHDDSK